MQGINNIMTKFENRFFKVLSEADEFTPDEEAFTASLDDGTDPDEFNASAPDINDVDDTAMAAAEASTAHQAEMTRQLEGWVSEMDNFLHKLNGQDGSIQSTLATSEADTIFDRMKQSEQRKITRVATELASLAESFRGYLSQTSNPAYKHV
jgi:hypothetical protein